MANGWTPERRARQADAIKRWRPWERSKGGTRALLRARRADARVRLTPQLRLLEH